MTEAREFWQFAKEAVQCASQSEDENEKLDFSQHIGASGPHKLNDLSLKCYFAGTRG